MICFHHNDLDGRCSAAVALRACPGGRSVEVSYNRLVPVDQTEPGEKVVIVDYTVPVEAMAALLERTRDITWIDHHRSALRVRYPVKLPGVLDMNKAACELTWNYFFPGRPVPEAVLLTADRDIWTWRFGRRTACFNEGMRLRDHQPNAALWDRLLADDAALMTEIQEQGGICLQYRDALCADYVRQFGFETEFEGHRGIAVALQYFGSDTFGPLMAGYDLGITFAYTGEGWAVSLFSREVDVGRLAEKHGGGGHRLAAGFVCQTLPFRRTGPLPETR
jgi:oligoribonuclease NrnB/cAMP/cGMP phosphodiesterase (DHH superfamily)